MNPNQLQKMMKQAQKLQGEMQSAQATLEQKEYSHSVGQGVVTVKVLGNKTIQSINIADDLIDVEEKDFLQEMITTALNEVYVIIDNEANDTMSKYTQGLPF